MEFTNQLILLAGVLFLISILASVVTPRLGVPLLLVFLIIGMLAGEDGIGGLVEYSPTEEIFTNPHDERTEAYITGRFG